MLEYLAKSERGLWVKGELGDDRVDVFWHKRFRCEPGFVFEIDANGDVCRKMECSNVEWGDCWVRCGEIPLTDEMVRVSGIEHFHKFSYGYMRHCVELIASGYGDDPSEVVGWFSDVLSMDFAAADSYRVEESFGFFDGLCGNMVELDFFDESKGGRVIVLDDEYRFSFDEDGVLSSFVIATIPC